MFISNPTILNTMSGTPRAWTPVTLAFNTARTPSTTYDVWVKVILEQDVPDGSTATAQLEVDTSGNGTYQQIHEEDNDFSVSGILGVTGHNNGRRTLSAKVPPTSQYKVTEVGTNTIINIFELLD